MKPRCPPQHHAGALDARRLGRGRRGCRAARWSPCSGSRALAALHAGGTRVRAAPARAGCRRSRIEATRCARHARRGRSTSTRIVVDHEALHLEAHDLHVAVQLAAAAGRHRALARPLDRPARRLRSSNDPSRTEDAATLPAADFASRRLRSGIGPSRGDAAGAAGSSSWPEATGSLALTRWTARRRSARRARTGRAASRARSRCARREPLGLRTNLARASGASRTTRSTIGSASRRAASSTASAPTLSRRTRAS